MVIQKSGSGYVLKSKKTGKVLGKHKTRAGAVRQDQAIHAAKAGQRAKKHRGRR